ncbi:uncharacterized protein LOC127873544 [Dreissena polymorpha]|uniref:Uncharacterized protein n=1 Tax=Dreissena polymorpha TaxID=45954 RepID=A0A9D4KSP4_DREPO|nr:uncharacterized protein LOC127873544 [Dreissena polymorpha]KAH3845166.1 hypothetical protein DPMN_087439 [Dreissena polymorpha]
MDGQLRIAFFLSALLLTLTTAQTESPEEINGGEALDGGGGRGAGQILELPLSRGGDSEIPTNQRTPSLLQDMLSFAQRATASDMINQQRVADTVGPIQDRPVLLSDFVQFATRALARGGASEGPSVLPTNEQPTDQTPPVLLTDLVQFVQSSMTTNQNDANFAPAEASNSGSTLGTEPVLLADLVKFVTDAKKASMAPGKPSPANSMAHSANDATTPEKTTIVNADPFDPENMPVEKFQNWLNNIKPETNNITAGIKTQTPDMHVAHTMTSPDVFWTRNMVIVVAVVGSTTLLCIALLTLVCCMRRRSGLSRKERDLMDKTFNSRQLNAFATIGSKNMDLFMGIPANNEIWRDLQTLPKSSSDSSVASQ